MAIGLLALALGSCQGEPRTEAQASAEQPRQALAAATDPVNVAAAATPGQSAADYQDGAVAKYPLQSNPLAGCSLCHVDVEDQFVGSGHFPEQVGCQTCHGPSAEHLADENNEVPPDELFARGDVDRLCAECHECGRSYRAEPATDPAREPRVCTDCHSPHNLAQVTP
ncbi:MAG: hypothetical protein A2W31_12760 [Planctomycetes bacterium RBG_16_64_10]|nr:MAG: hypothetical protein A2W31_12760 [Planctomycetes bacterium RBG_16_64_10]